MLVILPSYQSSWMLSQWIVGSEDLASLLATPYHIVNILHPMCGWEQAYMACENGTIMNKLRMHTWTKRRRGSVFALDLTHQVHHMVVFMASHILCFKE
jgi:hypothetical protein